MELRGLVCDSVALVDITLHQLYTKAKYDPQPGWKFDESVLGKSFGRRLKDKIPWVGKITGRPLDDVRSELESLNEIRRLRNHLLHFDPPCMAYSIEDAAGWLNQISVIARLAWKIRLRTKSPVTEHLIQLMLLPRIVFVPRDLTLVRIPQGNTTGYASVHATDSESE
jgi:hypothetical protein